MSSGFLQVNLDSVYRAVHQLGYFLSSVSEGHELHRFLRSPGLYPLYKMHVLGESDVCVFWSFTHKPLFKLGHQLSHAGYVLRLTKFIVDNISKS